MTLEMQQYYSRWRGIITAQKKSLPQASLLREKLAEFALWRVSSFRHIAAFTRDRLNKIL